MHACNGLPDERLQAVSNVRGKVLLGCWCQLPGFSLWLLRPEGADQSNPSRFAKASTQDSQASENRTSNGLSSSQCLEFASMPSTQKKMSCRSCGSPRSICTPRHPAGCCRACRGPEIKILNCLHCLTCCGKQTGGQTNEDCADVGLSPHEACDLKLNTFEDVLADLARLRGTEKNSVSAQLRQRASVPTITA